ncbi:MAG: hypothetical protein ACYC6L_12680 [Anaerolineae bacterium]
MHINILGTSITIIEFTSILGLFFLGFGLIATVKTIRGQLDDSKKKHQTDLREATLPFFPLVVGG